MASRPVQKTANLTLLLGVIIAAFVFLFWPNLTAPDFLPPSLSNDTFGKNESLCSINPQAVNIHVPGPPTIVDTVAFVIETRPLSTLIPLLLHFSSVLGPAWPVILYTTSHEVQRLRLSPPLQRMAHQIELRALPNDTLASFNDHMGVSEFFTRPFLWEDLAPAKHVLMFQTDSIICANSRSNVEEFFPYDFVGAPIREGLGRGYNGGLSLRNREKLLKIVQEHEFMGAAEPGDHLGYNTEFEDQWFALKLSQSGDGILPGYEVAQEFSVETTWYERPFGYHQIHRYQGGHVKEVESWCPEIKLVIGASFH